MVCQLWDSDCNIFLCHHCHKKWRTISGAFYCVKRFQNILQYHLAAAAAKINLAKSGLELSQWWMQEHFSLRLWGRKGPELDVFLIDFYKGIALEFVGQVTVVVGCPVSIMLSLSKNIQLNFALMIHVHTQQETYLETNEDILGSLQRASLERSCLWWCFFCSR